MSLLAYVKRYTAGYTNADNAKPVDATAMNAIETALLGLLGVAPTDAQFWVYDAALSRFKSSLISAAHIDPAAAIAKSQLASLGIVNADVASNAAIAYSKLNLAGQIQDTDLVNGGSNSDGWIAAGETWTYASTDGHTFTFTIAGVDKTGKYQAGQRIKLTQSATVRYFIITKVAFSTDTTITVYGGTAQTLANAAITSPYWSNVKAPFGLNLDPTVWTEQTTDTSDRSLSASAAWANNSNLKLDIPIGVWDVGYSASLAAGGGGGAFSYLRGTLSTANNSETDTQFTSSQIDNSNASSWYSQVERSKILVLTAKTTYYFNAREDPGSVSSSVTVGGSTASPTIIRARCAYL